MENIVMASVIGQPVADGTIIAGGGENNATGLFGMFLTQELTKLAGGERKAGNKKEGMAAGDSMLLMLMSALMQGVVGQGTVQENEFQAGIQTVIQADMQTDIQTASFTGQAGPAPISADAKEKAIALAFMKIVADGRGIGEALNALEPETAGKGGNGALIKELASLIREGAGSIELPEQLASRLKTDFPALLSALNGTGPEAAANPMQKGRPAALEAIRELFNELVGSEPAQMKPQETQNMPAITQPAVESQPNADIPKWVRTEGVPAEAANAPLVKLETIRMPHAFQPAVGAGKAPIKEAADGAGITGITHEEPATEQEPVILHALVKAWNGDSPIAAPMAADRPEAMGAAGKPGADAFESVVESITSLRDTAKNEMEIQLKPSFLGKVVIRLTMDEGGLVAKITASNPRVQDTFLNQAGTLQASLAEQGLKDVRVVVTSASVQDPSLQQEAHRRGQDGRQQGKRNRIAVDPAGLPAGRPLLLAYEAAYGTGTINYLA